MPDTRAACYRLSCAATAGTCGSSGAGSASKVVGLTWIVERTFAWLGFHRRLAKEYGYRVQTAETLIDIAAIRLMLNRIAPP